MHQAVLYLDTMTYASPEATASSISKNWNKFHSTYGFCDFAQYILRYFSVVLIQHAVEFIKRNIHDFHANPYITLQWRNSRLRTYNNSSPENYTIFWQYTAKICPNLITNYNQEDITKVNVQYECTHTHQTFVKNIWVNIRKTRGPSVRKSLKCLNSTEPLFPVQYAKNRQRKTVQLCHILVALILQ